MTSADYKNAGFQLSQYIDQSIITRAEGDITQAYIAPLLGHAPTPQDLATAVVKEALMACSYLLIMQRMAVATRAGGKQKQTMQSSTPTADQLLQQNAPTCVMKLQALAGSDKVRKRVNDICGLFFVTQYFNS